MGGVALVAALLVAGETEPAEAEPSQDRPDVADTATGDSRTLGETSLQETPLETAGTLASSGDGRVEAERQERDAFDLVGVTWADAGDAEGVDVQVQVRQDGTWSDWIDLQTDGAQAGEGDVRGGTDPLWVGSSDGVSARVIGSDSDLPDDVRVVTVDGGPEQDVQAEDPAATTASAVPAQPSVVTRSAWGAGSGTTCDSPVYGKLRGVMIHHTAGSNSYTKAQSASIVRSIQSYHVGGQGWCDIGYNLLVDKYGQIFEGRKGGWTRMVRGAHAGNFEVNKSAVGIAMMGNYETAHTATAQRNAVVRLVAWRLGSKDLPAKGSPYKIGGHTVQRIAMHRDVSATACPGRNGVNWVKNPGGLRDRVANAIASG
ncbi:N-acetylmuramoyl-L-alanine amidase [Aeromicrobium sp. CF4.19]|uniref:N-acetylmuramoyl-L-alanine amidase n=1 Tax=Aeromicrobium sp. CF4.19 TaxID=3373082 RepID=UPI003EE7B202